MYGREQNSTLESQNHNKGCLMRSDFIPTLEQSPCIRVTDFPKVLQRSEHSVTKAWAK